MPKKDDAHKTRYDLVPPGAIEAAASALSHGATKYAPHDWEGMPYGRIFASVQRHLWDWWGNSEDTWDCGLDTDKESGLPTLGHALAALMMLYETWNRSLGIDDRPAARRSRGPIGSVEDSCD